MSNISEEYSKLSASTPRPELASVLQKIIQAPQNSINTDTRQTLIRALLEDINLLIHNQKSSKSRLATKDAPQALLALKMLGYQREGSEVITAPANLTTLISASIAFKDVDPTGEALRCIANGLLLVDTARSVWVSKEVGGGEASVESLEKSTTPEQIFIASRLLFLSTASANTASGFIKALVEGKVAHHSQNIVDVIGPKLEVLLNAILAGTKFSREAMSELLKFAFNVAIHYPKIMDTTDDGSDQKGMGERWNDRLDGLLQPLLRTFNSLPPTFPSPLTSPMTQVIHALLTIPVSQSLHSKWFPRRKGSPATTPPSSHSSGTPRSSVTNSPDMVPNPSLPGSSHTESPPTKESKHGRVDRAFSSMLAAGRRSLSSRSNSPYRSSPPPDTLLHSYSLLDVSLAYYLPGDVDPDDPTVREKCKKEGETNLDDILTPLVVLITRMCLGDEGSRTRLREWVLPQDLDRTAPLESRSDFLGRCLRILPCVYHGRLKDAVGEMFYAMCDQDANLLSAQVGYGNIAGFLFNKGVFNPPSQSSGASITEVPSTAEDGTPINPITGVAQRPSAIPDMTDEEKEQEAEKLFVLFDRLEKSGSIQPSQNPIRQAVAQGKLG